MNLDDGCLYESISWRYIDVYEEELPPDSRPSGLTTPRVFRLDLAERDMCADEEWVWDGTQLRLP